MAKKKPQQNSSGNSPVKPQPAKPASMPQKQPSAPKAKAVSVDDQTFLQKYAQPLIIAGISLLTFLFFRTIINNQFTNWDDLGYITGDLLIKDLSAEGIKNIFSTAHPVMGNYHPLTILLYAIEYSYVGLKPWLYHLDSLLLHILVTISVYYLVKTLTGRMVAAAIAALLFGIHPMHVESVAWGAGRKDILYGLFYILTCITYINYIRNVGNKKMVWYISGLVLFALSLLCKSVAVTLPVTLFLFDYYENRKVHFNLILEKTPHFGLSLLFGILSIYAQKDIGALGTLDVSFNPLERFALGCYALCTYLWKAVVPVGLSNFYPYPMKENGSLPAAFYIYPVIIIGLLFIIWKFARRNRIVILGALFFLINIVLLLQFVPVGGAIMSDRYGYIPYFGLFLMAGWFVSGYFEVKEKIPTGKILLGITLAYSLVLGYMTNERCKDWYDSVTLWRDNIEKHPSSPIAYFYLGQQYFSLYEAETNPEKKKALADSTLGYFNESVARKPDYINPIICIGELQRTYNQLAEAKKTYYTAMNINAKNESVYLGLGIVFAMQRQFDSAEYCFTTALKLKPNFPEGLSNYANFLDIVGKVDSSIKIYGIAIAQNPDAPIPYMNRAKIYMKQGRYDLAIADYSRVLQVSPDNAEMYYSRGKAYALKGDKAQARQDIEKAKSLGYTQIDPNLLHML
jgi:protein O-mannosyl-transferase